jgi:DNA-binding NarL/FixJ family response regulator
MEEKMFKSIRTKKKKKTNKQDAERLLQLELSEIEELSSLLMSRIDERVKRLQAIEKRLDEKINILEGYLNRIDAYNENVGRYHNENPYEEVMVLARKGLKVEEIASLLDLSISEVELIIDMKGQEIFSL